MTDAKAMILGCSGTVITDDERAFYRDQRPWGFILFARNIAEPDQVRALIGSLREAADRPDAPVFIDQEGGRVQRLRPPIAPNYPAAAALGDLYRADPAAGLRAAWLLARLHALDLAALDVTANCFPVLDVPVEGAHDVIGNRAYGKDPATVAALGRASAEGLLSGGILPVMKHVPGHGRAYADTHLELPRLATPLDELRAHDFAPFKALSDLPMAMTAHVVYEAVDPSAPATTSPIAVRNIIRGEIGFDGLLISDDSSMKALSGDFAARSEAILAAGVDIVLHCNGVMDEMSAIASRVGPLQGRSLERARRALSFGASREAVSEKDLRAEFAGLVQAVA